MKYMRFVNWLIRYIALYSEPDNIIETEIILRKLLHYKIIKMEDGMYVLKYKMKG